MALELANETQNLSEHLRESAKEAVDAAANWLARKPADKGPLPQLDFRWWQCEGLLAQAAQLLDRAMTERRELRQLLDQHARRVADAVSESVQVDQLSLRAARNPRPEVIGLFTIAADSAFDAANTASHDGKSRDVWQSANAQGYALRAQQKEQESRNTYETALEGGTKARLEKLAGEDARGKAFDFATRAEALSKTIMADFEDALTRSMVSSVGIGKIYDNFSWLDQKIDDFSELLTQFSDDNLDSLEVLATWVRQAARCISISGELDQARTLVIDLPARVGAAQWQTLSNTFVKSGQVQFAFNVPTEAFGECSNVRVRGLTMTQDGCVPLVAEVSLPQLSPRRVKRRATLIVDEIWQGELPQVHFGRIHRASTNRVHDVLGAQSISNGSPTGNWNVTLTARSALFGQNEYGELPNQLSLEVIAVVFPGR